MKWCLIALAIAVCGTAAMPVHAGEPDATAVVIDACVASV